MIKDAIRVIEKEGEKYKTILTTDVIKLLKTIDEYHETELKKLRVADVIKNEVAVCCSCEMSLESNEDKFCRTCFENN